MGLKYTGDKVMTGGVLFRPLRIDHFEIVPSPRNKGKELLVAQLTLLNGDAVEKKVLFTESYSLINVIKGTEEGLPHFTRIVRKKGDRYNYFSVITEVEKEKLIHL